MRASKEIELKIVDQIRIAEVCFDICKSIPMSRGPGETFLPFFYNLSCSRGLIILHSLLISTLKNEITIDEYIKDYSHEKNEEKIFIFEKDIKQIKKSLREFYTIHLRHKVVAHLDKEYRHDGFTCSYMISEKLLDDFICIITRLKKVFFQFVKNSQDDYLINIKEETDVVIKFLEQEKQKRELNL